MSILVSAFGLRKAFGSRPLFDGITFTIESGERIGLIGPNGAGKSTLLRILSSSTQPDEGKLSLQRGLRVGYLEQVPSFKPNATIHSAIMEGVLDPDDWESIAKVDEVLSKLSLPDGSMPVSELSGGWKKRVALARELVSSPDLLLLDEPTNHLDVESILWLEDLITSSSFATLTVTHDRLFLQKVSQKIWELDRRNPGGLLSIEGSYADYLEVKEQQIQSQERREVVLKNTLRRETEWLRRGAKARTTKQQARIQRAHDLADETKEAVSRNQSRTARLDFHSAERNPKKLIEAKEISKSFNGREIFSKFDRVISPGSRIGILGSNGCGKSTLIKVLLGHEEPDSGVILRSENLSVAYFEQNRESLNPTVSLMKTLCPTGDFVSYRGGRIHIRSYLDRFLFSPDQMEMPVGKLSGGEQSRVLIARLMLQEANLLVLDEPTNDLDMATLNVLEECLTQFSGAVLLVTHDRYFLDQVSTQILAFPPQSKQREKITSFASLDQWELWYDQMKSGSLQVKGPEVSLGASPGGPGAKKKKLGFKEQRELDTMEERIHDAESQLARLTEESQLSENASKSTKLIELTTQMTQLQTEIDRLYARWAELEGSA